MIIINILIIIKLNIKLIYIYIIIFFYTILTSHSLFELSLQQLIIYLPSELTSTDEISPR